MNSSFEDMVTEIAAGATHPGWDAPMHTTGILAAYHEMKEQQRMAKTNPSDLADHNVLAGVNACLLASLALQVQFGEPGSVRARMTIAAANNVLQCWGIALEDAPGVVADPTTSAPVAPTSKPEVLVWPPVDRLGRPLSTVLPDVYRENYYHTLETAIVVENPTVAVNSGQVLVLRRAYWNEETAQWRMQFKFADFSFTEEVSDITFWLNHSQVKPGDEIPKVIDGATQARSNDP